MIGSSWMIWHGHYAVIERQTLFLPQWKCWLNAIILVMFDFQAFQLLCVSFSLFTIGFIKNSVWLNGAKTLLVWVIRLYKCVCVCVCVCVGVGVCVCVCVCVCACVFVTNENMNLYNDTGMTSITSWRWLLRTSPHAPNFQKAYKSYRVSFLALTGDLVSCEG